MSTGPDNRMMAEKSEFISPDTGVRLKGVTVIKPLVYGNVARYFGRKREEDGHTHEWTVYLKPFRNEDMSDYVKKVQFKLHESYANQNRILMKPPYEVTETGWGEFEIAIKVYFHDTNERPVTIYHVLKLFQSETNILMGKKSLVSEFYDELIFQDPSASLHRMLVNAKPFYPEPYRHETDFEEKKRRDLMAITSAKGKIQAEISELKEKLLSAKSNITRYRDEIAKAEKQGVEVEHQA